MNLNEIDLPTVLRRQRQESLNDGGAKADPEPKREKVKHTGTDGESYLDIPTFLRKQND